ncbi:MAG TPA: sulfurtransferase [Armatimonadota bacterium]|jgi:thiosulfate/3-mercaptopyruvate sulfurtransferase
MRFRVSLFLLLFLLLLLCCAMGVWADEQLAVVTPEWVTARTNDPNVRILDVRADPHEYFAGHVPNAVHMADNMVRGPREGVPVQYFPPALLGDLFTRAGVRKGQTVVVYSDGANVLGATMVAYVLEKIGVPHTAIVDGGWSVFKQAQPTSQQYPTYRPERLPVQENRTISVDLAQVKAAIGKPAITFVDARPYAAYAGEVKTWMRNGHIPGAINVDWHQLMDPNNPHLFKSVAAMQAIFNAKGVKKTDNIILYCGTSREASLEFMVMRHLLGYPNVRLYEGSWTEYSAHPELPMETGGPK